MQRPLLECGLFSEGVDFSNKLDTDERGVLSRRRSNFPAPPPRPLSAFLAAFRGGMERERERQSKSRDKGTD